MKNVSKQTIEEIRNACDIADVIGERIQLKKAGVAFRGLCPFHKEKTPSFNVNPQRQIFHCFGCGEGGDVFKFVQKYENVDFGTAMRMLAQRAGIRVEFDEADAGEAKAKDVLFKIHDELAQFYHRILLEKAVAEHARQYLARRDLGPEIVEQFLLGFAPNRYDTIAIWAEKKGYSIEQLEAAGFLQRREDEQGEKTGDIYDRFRNRLMFPIRDREGRVIGFSGRILDEETKAPKYYNSPETPLFRKSRVLYALDKAWRPMIEARTAILCEGQIDVIRCHAAGITNAVAAQGTAFTEEHARILNRHADTVVLIMDADPAGQNSAIKSARVLMAAGLSASVVTLPPGEDPDSLIRKNGAQGMHDLIAKAQTAIDFQIDVLSAREDVKTGAGLKRVTAELFETVAVAPSAVLRDQMLQQAAARLNLSEDALREDLKRRLSRVSRPSWEEAKDAPAKPIEHPVEEVGLAKMLVQHPECVPLIATNLPLQHFTDPDCRAIIAILLNGGNLTSEVTQASDECQRLAAEIQQADAKSAKSERSPAEAVQEMILRIWKRSLEERRKDLNRRKETSSDAEKILLEEELLELAQHIHLLGRGWDKAKPILQIHS